MKQARCVFFLRTWLFCGTIRLQMNHSAEKTMQTTTFPLALSDDGCGCLHFTDLCPVFKKEFDFLFQAFKRL